MFSNGSLLDGWKQKVQWTSNGNTIELANVHTIREPDSADSVFMFTPGWGH